MKRTTSFILLVAVALLVPPPAHASHCAPGDNGCDGYMRNANTYVDKVCATKVDTITGSTITRVVIPGPPGTVTGMCVFLPPNYESSGLRYPVMYLLHGGLGDQADWVDKGQIRQIMDTRYAADPSSAMIVVMPDGNSNGQWADALNGSFSNETYLTRIIVSAIDGMHRTIADRSGRIIEGLSNGGYGAMHLAAKRPDLFISAGGMSSNLELPTWSPNYGSAATAPAYQAGQTPRYLAMNLDDIDVILHVGNGCEQDDYARDRCAGLAVDSGFLPMNRIFVQSLQDAGHAPALLSYAETNGEHAWKYWQRWLSGPHLDRHLARIQHATSSPVTTPIPQTWRYTSVAPDISAWGYRFTVSTQRAREFLTITNVREDGLTLTGSGPVHVTTAARYEPLVAYLVEGALVDADQDGRLAFDVDLGPSHPDEQYSAAARGKEVAGDYFQTVHVDIERA